MRETILEGVEDKVRWNLGGNATLVATVHELGKAKDYLIYEATLTGEQLLPLMEKLGYDFSGDEIVKEHHYILTAFDD